MRLTRENAVGDGNGNGSAGAVAIPKPSDFDLNKFKSKRADAIANVDTLQTGLPVSSMSQAKDFVRLHPDEDYWSPELCFVMVPIKGAKRDSLHLIEEDLAMRFLPSGKVQRFRLALATKPNDVFFLCRIPTRNLDNSWNRDNVAGCEQAKKLWTQATSRGEEGVDAYLLAGRTRPRRLPGTEMAGAIALRPHRPGLRWSDDRQRRPSGIAASDWRQAVGVVSGNFGRIIVADFEYEVRDGDLPNVLCMVAYELDEHLQHVAHHSAVAR